ncbi:glycosyltransferase involved in cell wall biosynthesis [Leucobacter exalbidus]|uniref:Glycosyltransferase involved in cell wall biosynthesis n=1 Tax=Leucobacter exalbidus TaxID=662960 RepID=A0A940PSQ2_9MICO|nr:glycosyltransferase [Leucobacter exalbidus]MBP1326097.1 glycosyltransferase involved in cell wall biosynthesis [Leucobacter exalbidus]
MNESAHVGDFSLLLPVYAGDDASYLRLAFESSVTAQTLRPAEVVIVQDGPVNDALVAELARIESESLVPVRVVRLTENGGLTRALNAGLAECDYPVVARMDADDVSVPQRFARQWALIEEGFDLVGTGMVEFDNDPAQLGAVRVPPVGSERIRNHARSHNPFNHPTIMYRVEALDRVGRYEPFGKMEDYWLGIRMISSGARVENISEPLVKYRVGSGAFARRGGWTEARTEWKLQGAMLKLGFITRAQYLRNVVLKGAYRLMPAWAKKIVFREVVGKGLPGERKSGV